MEDYVYYEGKKLRKGYTTGTCAAAAAKAAAAMIIQQEKIAGVTIITPNGTTLQLPVDKQEFDRHTATAAVQKDGGDDIDATHGMRIFAQVTLNGSGEIRIDGGQGIGRVTQKGIAVPVGEAAINPVPRRMIAAAVREEIGPDRGADVVIFAPEGEERAERTMNSRLGILGGISILGTTGIVTPMSDEGWKQSLSIELEMKRAQGFRKIILVPGNYGERFVEEQLGIDGKYVVSMSNFVGYMLKETQRLAFEHVLMVGHFGKLIKVSAGIFTTYSKDADARAEILVANLALAGAPLPLLQRIAACATTEAAGEIMVAEGYSEVFQTITDKVKQRAEQFLKYSKPAVDIDVITFSTDRGMLASTCDISTIKEAWL
ncbi:MAG: cobalt-precorrin-5B (C(1))-methyltransferase CbiD [Paenibacillus dendritiformis]|uniref:cobalt-precorrin-5B (C(1))-methyltransferase CbiD n=1 Tax=Paenibacillus dendritiformis TaxID=130049 RepID=UPI00143DF47A|nr:cobalt-precorrin-5B (C(1))-methyltransferase CbiD [Paenibacillus dendritiformis]MDU5146002.1 cobalt-precorrin-5B (C(1))-methyltransferase CbiD [Paenibacillus dendritiformis]NKI23280.1 cobalt-precorrin-5B (C(1))-methyltransferase [Paenibacillus dendritiformis]NRF99322.1 cobalt-precorrin-5B (C(1))-methyltransferase [Paenibacillus dendritiformis]GIO76305.1 cobalt-precorrin-5B C(1)-methyltransferase [Paenibacillus dendritiformis]